VELLQCERVFKHDAAATEQSEQIITDNPTFWTSLGRADATTDLIIIITVT